MPVNLMGQGPSCNIEHFVRDSHPAVRGFLHHPRVPFGDALVLTHGAGSNCEAPILVALAIASAEAGFTVLRCDLPFRQERPKGPPSPGGSPRDRQGLQNAIKALRGLSPGHPFDRVFLGGHSYGGRQASILAAADPGITEGLLLLSYPLHPPAKPSELRTTHFPELHTPALFVHGAHDPFGTLDEMKSALRLIPASTSLLPIEGAGHDLNFGRGRRVSASPGMDQWSGRGIEAFQAFIGK